MTHDQFMLTYSQLLEHYQFIEHHLEGIYAFLCGKPFCEGLGDVEYSSLSQLIRLVYDKDRESETRVISSDEYSILKELCQNRNYWVHSCFVGMPMNAKTGVPKKQTDIDRLLKDLRSAENMRDMLYSRIMELYH